jgi:hypothetical protein
MGYGFKRCGGRALFSPIDEVVTREFNFNLIKIEHMWRLWARALGEKVGNTNKEADTVARFRTMIIVQAVITNFLIALNIIIGWL